MKKYSLTSTTSLTAAADTPISDGAVFVFILSHAALKNIWQAVIVLTLVHEGFYVGIFESVGQIVTQYSPKREGHIPVCTKHDFTNTNIVVKMEKSRAGYSIYVDGTPCHTSRDKVTVSGVTLRAFLQGGQLSEHGAGFEATLLVFDETERGQAERIAQAMRDGNMEDGAENEKAVTDRELALDAKEKALEQRELKILTLEKALELRLAEFNASSGGGSNVANSDGSDQTFSQVQLPGADAIRLSATQAWPKAVKYILKSSGYTLVKTRHDILMNEWVEAKGNNISPDSYDYFVFSLGVGWPKAVRELTTDVNLARIREKQDEYMDLLIT